MAEQTEALPTPTLEEIQHWTWVMGRAQQLLMEHAAKQMQAAAKAEDAKEKPLIPAGLWQMSPIFADPGEFAQAQVELWNEGLSIWQRAFGLREEPTPVAEKANKDKRFGSAEWRDNPVFDMIRQSYLAISERLLGTVDTIEGINDGQ